jgi:hypothetical protein
MSIAEEFQSPHHLRYDALLERFVVTDFRFPSHFLTDLAHHHEGPTRNTPLDTGFRLVAVTTGHVKSG